MITVTTPASSYRLATLSSLKTELGVVNNDRDEYLGELLDQSSQIIHTYLGRIMARETIQETLRDDEIPSGGGIKLSRYPVSTFTSITVDGEALAADEYEVDMEYGIVYRLSNDYRLPFCAQKIVMVYTSGYVLPGNATRNLPADIERACLDVAKGRYYSQQRDPALKAETIPGVIEQQFWVGQVGSESGGIPSMIASSLDAYREVYV